MKHRVLITGAGGPSAISYLKALGDDYQVIMADMDPYAAGLYLSKSVLIPAANDPNFINALLGVIEEYSIDILVPTVDAELEVINEHRAMFDHVLLAMSPKHILDICLDKWELSFKLMNTDLAPQCELGSSRWAGEYPVIVKPRRGSGSRGIRKIETKQEHTLQTNHAVTLDSSVMTQEYLPGKEFSVDVYVNNAGRLIGCVPRERLKVDSGIAVTARTLHYPLLEQRAKQVIEILGLTGLANLQFKEDVNGLPKLMEINARCPGTMPLTVESGVNMPLLQIKELSGIKVNEPLDFKEIVMVRHLQETYLAADGLKDSS